MDIEKKNSTINDYILLQTLGEGLNSKVKLAMKKSDGKYYAVKIINDNSASHEANNIKAIITEAKILQTLDHPNIMHVFELREDGVYTKPDGSTKKVLFAVLQLANGGEVFDFLSTTGRFPEPISRYYFRQLIDALDHCHSKGFAHRDIKPENLLFDEDFNLLLADFGFSTPMAGKDGSGKLKTVLGTDNYMAPEIHSKAPYIGSSVDLFAAGIILFIFFTGHPPFNHAKATDAYYSLICMNNHEKFWNFHSRKKPNGLKFFSPEFINLINAMLAFDPTQRPSIAEIKAHPWFKGEVPTKEQIKEEFLQRKAKVDEEVAKKKKEIEDKKAMTKGAQANVAFNGVQARFRDVTIKREGAEDIILDDKCIKQLDSIKLERQPPVYKEFGTKKMTNLYSAFTPEQLLKSMVIFANTMCKNVELDLDNFRIKCAFNGKDGSVIVDMNVYVNDFASVLQFMKKEGDHFEYLDFIEKFKKQIEKLEDETFKPSTPAH